MRLCFVSASALAAGLVLVMADGQVQAQRLPGARGGWVSAPSSWANRPRWAPSPNVVANGRVRPTLTSRPAPVANRPAAASYRATSSNYGTALHARTVSAVKPAALGSRPAPVASHVASSHGTVLNAHVSLPKARLGFVTPFATSAVKPVAPPAPRLAPKTECDWQALRWCHPDCWDRCGKEYWCWLRCAWHCWAVYRRACTVSQSAPGGNAPGGTAAGGTAPGGSYPTMWNPWEGRWK
jgi:hypothetical protein